MNVRLKTGSFSVKRYGDEHYAISVLNRLDGTLSVVNFVTKDELRSVKNEIERILKGGDKYATDFRSDAGETSGMESVMETRELH